MGKFLYTKDDLEKIVLCQLENLNAMNDLITLLKVQNGILEKANKRLEKAITAHDILEKYEIKRK
jgi:hypothetical protein